MPSYIERLDILGMRIVPIDKMRMGRGKGTKGGALILLSVKFHIKSCAQKD